MSFCKCVNGCLTAKCIQSCYKCLSPCSDCISDCGDEVMACSSGCTTSDCKDVCVEEGEACLKTCDDVEECAKSECGMSDTQYECVNSCLSAFLGDACIRACCASKRSGGNRPIKGFGL